MMLSGRREVHVGWLPIAAAFLALLPAATAPCGEAKRTGSIRVAIFAGDGASKKAPVEIKACLPPLHGFDVKLISEREIRDGGLADFEVVIHPGGSGSGQAKALGDAGRERVRQFVRQGGGFVGVCAGAYLASAKYPWALGLLDAQVIDSEHWARGTGNVELRLTAAGQAALRRDDATVTIHYENGPLLGPASREDIPDFETLAVFETELRKNDAPKGVMRGTTAIARGRFGKGRVVCFSPHPERTREHQPFITEMVRWAGGGPASDSDGASD